MARYNKIVKDGPQHALSNLELDEMGKEIKNYIGTYAYDEIPKEFKNGNKTLDKSCIINTKTRLEGGEHWLALIKNNSGDVIMYDSFARKSEKLRLPNKYIETDSSIEQGLLESNCGLRCIAFLKCCDEFGIDKTISIL